MNVKLLDIENADLYWYFPIAENEWYLSQDEMRQLLGVTNSQHIFNMGKKDSLPEDTITRLIYFLRFGKFLVGYSEKKPC